MPTRVRFVTGRRRAVVVVVVFLEVVVVVVVVAVVAMKSLPLWTVSVASRLSWLPFRFCLLQLLNPTLLAVRADRWRGICADPVAELLPVSLLLLQTCCRFFSTLRAVHEGKGRSILLPTQAKPLPVYPVQSTE